LSKDISTLVAGWGYDPGRVNARWITGIDGLPKIQLRLDLGLLQMEMEGRPDGAMPRGSLSLLDYFLGLEDNLSFDHPALRLDEEACTELQQEAVQYYYRYLSFAALGHLDGVIRDTEHNLEIFHLVSRHAVDEELAWQFMQFYSYVRMMHSRAVAEKVLESKDYTKAIRAMEEGIADIEAFLDDYEELDDDDEYYCEELDIMAEILDNLRKRKPKSKEDQLKENMQHAIASENYEQAALLRDALKKMSKGKKKRV